MCVVLVTSCPPHAFCMTYVYVFGMTPALLNHTCWMLHGKKEQLMALNSILIIWIVSFETIFLKTFSYKYVFVNQHLSSWTVQTWYNLQPATCCETPSVSDLFQASLFLSIVSLPADPDCWKGEVSKVSTYLLRKRGCFSFGFCIGLLIAYKSHLSVCCLLCLSPVQLIPLFIRIYFPLE